MANYGIKRTAKKQRKFLAQLVKREHKQSKGYSDYFKAKAVPDIRSRTEKIAKQLRGGQMSGLKKKLGKWHGTKY